ncbi:hypothetical protein MSIMFB_01086 [Mycobacterium simulans]|uniref:Uncharacterized protein n=1 Tax=Mycobacterium simulans TaxID=627089 RepID=A0A7Z7IHI6_9MYCO|nr:hypothetical protein MSIMFB_01086 [Mycobacterium simulans]
MAMPPTKRHNRKPKGNDPVLPRELRSFDRWYYPDGLHDYMATLSAFLVDPQRLTSVMNAAGLSAADWFRHMLTRIAPAEPTGHGRTRTLRLLPDRLVSS